MKLKSVAAVAAGLVFGTWILRQLLLAENTVPVGFDVDVSSVRKAMAKYCPGQSIDALHYELGAWVSDTTIVIAERHGVGDQLVISSQLEANTTTSPVMFRVRVVAGEVGKIFRNEGDFKLDFHTFVIPGDESSMREFAEAFENQVMRYAAGITDWKQVRKWEMIQT